jgi:hypothetical protein
MRRLNWQKIRGGLIVAGIAIALVVAGLIETGPRLALGATGAPSSSPVTGQILTSPVVVCGSLRYNGGPQSSGIPACGGTFTANSGTPVTVANTAVTANSVVLFGLKTAGGTPAAPFMVTVTPGTGFTVNSGGSDTSVYNYVIFG